MATTELKFWHSNQKLCIKWGTQTSTFCTISNGVRQGEILSPVCSLFTWMISLYCYPTAE